MKILKLLSLLAVMALATASFGQDLDDPADLHTGSGSGTTCATGTGGGPSCPLYGNEVTGVTGNTFDIYQNSNGAGTLNVPFLLILGVPNSTNPSLFSNSSITGITSINKYPGGVTDSSGTWNFQGYAGNMTSGDVYHQSFLPLSGNGIDASNSFTNWSQADSTVNHINATGFGIYVFQVNATLGPNGLVNFTFANGALPLGTFIVGYGNDGKHVYVNPFTEAGLTVPPGTPGGPTPEPASLALLGTGLLGLGAMVRRKTRSA